MIAGVAALIGSACASGSPRPPEIAAPEPNVERTTGGAPAAGVVDEAAAIESADDALATAHGEATYYADMFEGRRTASGIIFTNDEMFAAHREYPFGTVVRVTELESGRDVVVRVVDRLPPPKTARARRTIIDLSQRAAKALGFMRAGRVDVRVEVLEWGRSRR